jgi:hypothetical protein
VEKAVTAGSNYYTLAYSPTNRDWKGDYRKIHVKLAQQGLTLAYRRGYFADDPNAQAHHGEAASANKANAPYDAMHAAMMRGAPEPTQIIFEANVRPSIADAEAEVAPGNKLISKANGPYRRYTVLYTADPKDVDCAVTPDNAHHCTLEFITFVYDADGTLVNTQSNGIKAEIPAARYAAIRHSGIQFRQEISVPVKGDYYLRIGIRDDTTDHVGAIELPIAAVSKLPPVSAKTSTPNAAAAPK